jgi:dUTP pyrophosphatase
LVLPRSGLGGKQGLVLGNLVGLIDNDYQGEIVCFMWNRNNSGQPMHIQRGMKFAQLMFIPFLPATILQVREFSSVTERGVNGFGSTGVMA